jgi:hypothetical protein
VLDPHLSSHFSQPNPPSAWRPQGGREHGFDCLTCRRSIHAGRLHKFLRGHFREFFTAPATSNYVCYRRDRAFPRVIVLGFERPELAESNQSKTSTQHEILAGESGVDLVGGLSGRRAPEPSKPSKNASRWGSQRLRSPPGPCEGAARGAELVHSPSSDRQAARCRCRCNAARISWRVNPACPSGSCARQMSALPASSGR